MTSKYTPQMTQAQRDERNALIFRFYLGGWSWREIARHHKVGLRSSSHVGRIIKAELAKLEPAQELATDKAKQIYAERLEHLIRIAWAKATNGDLKAVEVARRLMAQQAAFYGLNAEVPIRMIPPAEPLSDNEIEGGTVNELEAYRQRHRPPS